LFDADPNKFALVEFANVYTPKWMSKDCKVAVATFDKWNPTEFKVIGPSTHSSQKYGVFEIADRCTSRPASWSCMFVHTACFGGSATLNFTVESVTDNVMLVYADNEVVAGPLILNVPPAAPVV
jgi:hypothetical protein